MENKNGSESQEANITLLPEGCIANVVSFTTPRDSSLFKNASPFGTGSCLPIIMLLSLNPPILLSYSLRLPRNTYLAVSVKNLSSSTTAKRVLHWINGVEKSVICCLQEISTLPGVLLLPTGSGILTLIPAFFCSDLYFNRVKYTALKKTHIGFIVKLEELEGFQGFGEVAELLNVCWLEITGKISTNLLSLLTLYSAYLVFKLKERAHGLLDPPAEAIVRVGAETERNKRTVYLDTDADSSYRMSLRRQGPVMLRTRGRLSRRIAEAESPVSAGPNGESENGQQGLKKRGDGWVEVELGEFFNENVNDEELVVSVLEVKQGNWKSGLVVEGIEIRPKH